QTFVAHRGLDASNAAGKEIAGRLEWTRLGVARERPGARHIPGPGARVGQILVPESLTDPPVHDVRVFRANRGRTDRPVDIAFKPAARALDVDRFVEIVLRDH